MFPSPSSSPRFLVAVLCVPMLASVGCSTNKFAGEWLEEGRYNAVGEYTITPGPRRMAIKFEPIATVRTGAYVDGPGVVDRQVMSNDTYFLMQKGNVAQFGATIARVEGDRMTTWVGAEGSRQFVRRPKGPSVFPPQVVIPSLEGAAGGG
jgi:hypothetical protein